MITKRYRWKTIPVFILGAVVIGVLSGVVLNPPWSVASGGTIGAIWGVTYVNLILIKYEDKENQSWRRRGERVDTVDITPTWTSIMPAIIAVLEDGTEEGKKMAREELMELAKNADGIVRANRSVDRACDTLSVPLKEV